EGELKDLTRFYVQMCILSAEKNDEALTIGTLRYLASPSLTINVIK
ncbi:12058_t:CDS:2, partial [Funneliformis geosporum]